MRLTTSPWGEPDHQEDIADGIVFVSTPSHGGFFLDAKRNAKGPAAWRAASTGGQGKRGWYEEDCDWSMVVLAFPELFTELNRVANAQRCFDRWVKPRLAKMSPRIEHCPGCRLTDRDPSSSRSR